MTLQELSEEINGLLTQLPAQTIVSSSADIASTISLVTINDGGVKKVVIVDKAL